MEVKVNVKCVEEKDETPKIDKSKWNGVSVYIEADDEGSKKILWNNSEDLFVNGEKIENILLKM